VAKWWKRALGLQGRDRATALVTEGYVHARSGRVDDARRSYEAAVDADDTLAVAHLNLGLARLDLYNRDRAELDDDARRSQLDSIAASLKSALSLDEKTPVGWRALANVEERRAQFAAADDAWAKVESLLPADDVADRAEAKSARNGLEKRALADRARARALSALDVHTLDEAARKSALAELVQVADDVVRGYALAGSLARRLRDRVLARSLLEQAVARDPGDVEALRELASVALEDEDYVRALSASMDAYRALPTDAGLVCNVGVCHLYLGDLTQAEEFIELAHRLEPKDMIVLRARDALGRARSI
jgi:predicted Zn-dependent protease